MIDKQEAIRRYNSGIPASRLCRDYKCGHNTLVKILNEAGIRVRNLSEAGKLRSPHSDITRQKLSDSAKLSIQKGNKVWTKPEQEFKKILNILGLKVRFPDSLKELLGLIDDGDNATVYFQYPLQRYICDFVDVQNKTVFQVNGDFWHANPSIYEDGRLTIIQLHNRRHDLQRRTFLTNQGYRVLEIWESDIYWNVESLIRKLRACMSTEDGLVYTEEVAGAAPATPTDDWSEMLKKLWFGKPRVPKKKVIIQCKICGKNISLNASQVERRKCCSEKCSMIHRRKTQWPSQKELSEEIRNFSWVAIGRKYGVSDTTVKKWARRYGLTG